MPVTVRGRASNARIGSVTERNGLVLTAWSNFGMQDAIVKPVTVELDRYRVELLQPLRHRPDVIVVTTSDGRRAILGDRDPFTVGEYRAIDEATTGPIPVATTGTE